MDKIKDMMHGGHKKEGEGVNPTNTEGGYGQPGVAQTTGTGTGNYPTGTDTYPEGGHEKKGLFGLGGHKEGEEKKKKKGGIMGIGGGSSSSSSSSDEEREGARERNRLRREKRAQRHGGVGTTTTSTTTGTTTIPLQGGEKKHGFFG